MTATTCQSVRFAGGLSAAMAVGMATAPSSSEASLFTTTFDPPTYSTTGGPESTASILDQNGWTGTTTPERALIVEGGVDGNPAALSGTQLFKLDATPNVTTDARRLFAPQDAPLSTPFSGEVVISIASVGNLEVIITHSATTNFNGARFGFNSDGIPWQRFASSDTDVLFGNEPILNTWIRFAFDVDPAAGTFDPTVTDAVTGDPVGQGTESDLPFRGNVNTFSQIRFITSGSGATVGWVDSVSIVPEPASLALLGLSGTRRTGDSSHRRTGRAAESPDAKIAAAARTSGSPGRARPGPDGSRSTTRHAFQTAMHAFTSVFMMKHGRSIRT